SPPAPAEPYTLPLHDALPIWAAELPFDQSNAQAAPEPRFVHVSGSLGWPGGHPYGAGWGIALHRRVIPTGMGGTGRQVQTSFGEDRKSTRLNSSHQIISYAVF